MAQFVQLARPPSKPYQVILGLLLNLSRPRSMDYDGMSAKRWKDRAIQRPKSERQETSISVPLRCKICQAGMNDVGQAYFSSIMCKPQNPTCARCQCNSITSSFPFPCGAGRPNCSILIVTSALYGLRALLKNGNLPCHSLKAFQARNRGCTGLLCFVKPGEDQLCGPSI